jgi:hypothetical protein
MYRSLRIDATPNTVSRAMGRSARMLIEKIAETAASWMVWNASGTHASGHAGLTPLDSGASSVVWRRIGIAVVVIVL